MKKVLVLLVTILSFIYTGAQQTESQFNVAVNYLLYLPQDYNKDTAKRWPVVIFLHGSGESGTDVKKVKVHGPPKLIEEGKQYPFIVVSPQAPPREGWEPTMMFRFIKGLKDKYRVDAERVYLTGLSMGGFGTWAIAMKYPTLFAAIAPICGGGGDSSEAWKLKHLPVWCFHGAKDDAVKPAESYKMMAALKKYNPSARLTIYPEAGHDSWTQTYNNDSLYTWLLAQKKFHFERKAIPEKELNEFAGAYAQKGQDTIHLIVQEGKLLLKEQPSLELIPSKNNNFFIVAGENEIEIMFHRNKNEKVEKFILYEDKMREFYRIFK